MNIDQCRAAIGARVIYRHPMKVQGERTPGTRRNCTARAVAANYRHRSCGLMTCFPFGSLVDEWARA